MTEGFPSPPPDDDGLAGHPDLPTGGGPAALVRDLGTVIQTVFDDMAYHVTELTGEPPATRRVASWVLVAESVDEHGNRQVTSIPSDRQRAASMVGMLMLATDMAMAATRYREG